MIVIFAVITLFMLERLSAPAAADAEMKNLVTAATGKDNGAAAVAEKAIDAIKVRQQAGQDLAKQLLTMLGTLLAAISSFYFGASTTASGANAATRLPDKTGGDGKDNSGAERGGGPSANPPPPGAFSA